MSGINGTFGNSAAAVTLAKMVSTDEKQMAKVGKVLSNFSLTLHELNKIDSRISLNLGKIIMLQTKAAIDKYPETYKTYLANVISMRYKIWVSSKKGQTPYKTRKTWEKE